MTPNPHKNYSSDWYTPDEWDEWVSATLGSFVLDPCPRRWGGSVSGLERNWAEKVYCNPPGSNSSASVKKWWNKARSEWTAGRLQKLVWCFFNYEATYAVDPSPWELRGWMVMPRRRIGFVNAATGKVQKGARNRCWFWTNVPPAETPVPCLIVPTGTHSYGVRSIGGAA